MNIDMEALENAFKDGPPKKDPFWGWVQSETRTPLWAPRPKCLKSLNKSEHFFTKKRIFSLASCQAFPYTLNHDEDMEMDDWRAGRRL